MTIHKPVTLATDWQERRCLTPNCQPAGGHNACGAGQAHDAWGVGAAGAKQHRRAPGELLMHVFLCPRFVARRFLCCQLATSSTTALLACRSCCSSEIESRRHMSKQETSIFRLGMYCCAAGQALCRSRQLHHCSRGAQQRAPISAATGCGIRHHGSACQHADAQAPAAGAVHKPAGSGKPGTAPHDRGWFLLPCQPPADANPLGLA